MFWHIGRETTTFYMNVKAFNKLQTIFNKMIPAIRKKLKVD